LRHPLAERYKKRPKIAVMSYTNGAMSKNLTIPSANGNGVTDSPLAIAVSISPTTSSNLHNIFRQNSLSQPTNTIRPAKVLHPVASGDFRLLLLENISQGAVQHFKQQGFQVDWHPKAWSEDELIQKIGQYHAIGIRSKTKITEKVIKAASKVTLSA
jgi:D-3-phosphoglycerate dehydrogenase